MNQNLSTNLLTWAMSKIEVNCDEHCIFTHLHMLLQAQGRNILVVSSDIEWSKSGEPVIDMLFMIESQYECPF